MDTADCGHAGTVLVYHWSDHNIHMCLSITKLINVHKENKDISRTPTLGFVYYE